MTIIDKIKASITNATGLPFYYDSPQTLNVRMSEGDWKLPCAMLYILQSNALISENGIIRERLNIEVLFSKVSVLDFDGETVEKEQLDEMKQEAFKWLLGLYRSHELRVVALNNTRRYYATDDAILAAYAVNVTIEEIAGVSKCDFDTTT